MTRSIAWKERRQCVGVRNAFTTTPSPLRREGGAHAFCVNFALDSNEGRKKPRRRVLTDDNRRDLGHLAHIVVGLHDALYAGDGKVDGDVDVGGRLGGAIVLALHALAPGRVEGCEGRVVFGHVVCILHALLLAQTPRHGLGGRVRQRQGLWLEGGRGGGGRVGQGEGDGAAVALVLGMDGLVVVVGVVARRWGLRSPRLGHGGSLMKLRSMPAGMSSGALIGGVSEGGS